MLFADVTLAFAIVGYPNRDSTLSNGEGDHPAVPDHKYVYLP